MPPKNRCLKPASPSAKHSMSRFYYDLHIHSCLSPCGDDDMTVNNIAGMAKLKGLDIIALTDHNTCANCPAFFAACKKQGIVPVAGMELTTAEEIHMICLFGNLADAMEFENVYAPYRMKLKNRPEIFGSQRVLNDNDEIIAEHEFLLTPASSLSLEEAYALAVENGGLCYPAHADKTSNGIIGILGALPENLRFTCTELSANADKADFIKQNPSLAVDFTNKLILKNSDAHYLWDISEAVNYLELDANSTDGAEIITKQLFARLKGGTH